MRHAGGHGRCCSAVCLGAAAARAWRAPPGPPWRAQSHLNGSAGSRPPYHADRVTPAHPGGSEAGLTKDRRNGTPARRPDGTQATPARPANRPGHRRPGRRRGRSSHPLVKGQSRETHRPGRSLLVRQAGDGRLPSAEAGMPAAAAAILASQGALAGPATACNCMTGGRARPAAVAADPWLAEFLPGVPGPAAAADRPGRTRGAGSRCLHCRGAAYAVLPADSGRASWLGSRSRFGGLERSWSSAPRCRYFPRGHLVGEVLDEDQRLRKSLFHGGGRSPSCGTSAPAGVPLAKGIRPLGRQCHRPSSNTASLGDEGVMGEACL